MGLFLITSAKHSTTLCDDLIAKDSIKSLAVKNGIFEMVKEIARELNGTAPSSHSPRHAENLKNSETS